MTGQTHVGIGLLAGASAHAVGMPGPNGLISWLALAVGTLAPDLDGGGLITKPSAWVPALFPMPKAADRTGRAVGRAVSRRFRHRGVLHYPLVAVILGILAFSLDSTWLVWFAVGYASHLLADSLTKGGIPVWGPLSKKRHGLLPKVLRISNGSRIESVLSTVVWAGFLGLVVVSVLNLQFLFDLRPKRNTIFIPFVRKG